MEQSVTPFLVETGAEFPPVLPVAQLNMHVSHEHMVKNSFFRSGLGMGCGCLSAIALAIGGCVVIPAFFVALSEPLVEVNKSNRASLVEVLSSSFTRTSDRFAKSTIALEIKNNGDKAIQSISFHGVLKSPKRTVPWAEGDFSHEVAGGVESGETAKWELSPNMLSDFYRVHPPVDAEFIVTVVDVTFVRD
jgi:hypothetical protein